jgi:hypothetical protein
LDLNESSQLCEQSLFVRSKPLPLRTWLRKWKRDSWTQHLFGRILKPSLGQSFVTAWTSSLGVIHASHSVQLVEGQETKIQDISGPTSQMELGLCGQESAFSRTSKDTSRWDSPQSSVTWKKWVIRCRGEYSQRLNAARATQESEYLYWPTPTTRDWKGCYQSLTRKDGKNRGDLLPDAVNIIENSHLEKDSNNTTGSHLESFPLNPRWVEAMMGTPIYWTVPSCSHLIAKNVNAAENQSAQDAMTTTQTVRVQVQTVKTDNRTDELRLLGNGVVPATAEKAFITLINEQNDITKKMAGLMVPVSTSQP